MSKYDVPRGNCLWCGRHITAHDYWFWWLRRSHRHCKLEMKEQGEK